MSKARLLSLGGLLAAAGAVAIFVVRGQGGGGGSVALEPPAITSAGSAAEDPEDQPKLIGTLAGANERKQRALERALAAWAEAKGLLAAGKAKEAAAVLAQLRVKHPGFVDDPGRSAEAVRIETAAKAIDAEKALAAFLASKALTAEQRLQFEGRLAASAEILARAANDEDLDRLSRHLKRFLLPDGAAGAADSKDWADVQLRTFVEDRRTRRAGDAKPPVADAEAAEQRRLEQLEKLRQRDVVGLLDSIHAGLAWLAIHQRDDGSFCDAATVERCGVLKHATPCLDKWPNTGDAFVVANTALVLLSFLDFRDQDPLGWFDPYLARGLAWLVKKQKPDGSFPGAGQHYTTAMAIMALAQASASTGAEDMKEATRKGIAYLVTALGPLGGFRYGKNDPGDLSVTAWVAQAVEMSRAAGIEIPLLLSSGLETFMKYVWLGDKRFVYLFRGPEKASLVPAGMLLGHIIGQDKDEAVAKPWKEYLAGLRVDQRPDLYTLYYGVRVSILLNGTLADPWRTWVFDLAKRQIHGTVASGSFPGDLWRWSGGVTTQTAVAVLTLEHSLYLR